MRNICAGIRESLLPSVDGIRASFPRRAQRSPGSSFFTSPKSEPTRRQKSKEGNGSLTDVAWNELMQGERVTPDPQENMERPRLCLGVSVGFCHLCISLTRRVQSRDELSWGNPARAGTHPRGLTGSDTCSGQEGVNES